MTSHSSAWSIIAWKPLKNQPWHLEKHKNIKNVTFYLSFVYSLTAVVASVFPLPPTLAVCVCQLSCCVTGLMSLNVTSSLGCCSPGETLARHRQTDTTHWQVWLVLRKHFDLVVSLHTHTHTHSQTHSSPLSVCFSTCLSGFLPLIILGRFKSDQVLFKLWCLRPRMIQHKISARNILMKCKTASCLRHV